VKEAATHSSSPALFPQARTHPFELLHRITAPSASRSQPDAAGRGVARKQRPSHCLRVAMLATRLATIGSSEILTKPCNLHSWKQLVPWDGRGIPNDQANLSTGPLRRVRRDLARDPVELARQSGKHCLVCGAAFESDAQFEQAAVSGNAETRERYRRYFRRGTERLRCCCILLAGEHAPSPLRMIAGFAGPGCSCMGSRERDPTGGDRNPRRRRHHPTYLRHC
jgi:hypothetical protein